MDCIRSEKSATTESLGKTHQNVSLCSGAFKGAGDGVRGVLRLVLDFGSWTGATFAVHRDFQRFIVFAIRILPPVPSYRWDMIRPATVAIWRYAAADSSLS